MLRRKSPKNITKHETNDSIVYGINTITDDDDNNTPNIATINTDITALYNINLSIDPIDNIFDIPITTNGTHSTLGFVIENYKSVNRVKLISYIPGTHAAKIPKWRSILRN